MSKIRNIELGKITLPENLLRQHVDEECLDELADSIKTVGLLQPIVVRQKGAKWELIAGLRRYMAHKLLHKGTILAVCHPEDYDQAEAAALAENVQREALPLVDEAQYVRRLVDDHGWGISETARRLSKSITWVRDRLDVLRLPPTLAGAVQQELISMGAALELARIPDDALRDQYTHYAVEGGVSIGQAKRWRQQAITDLSAGFVPQPADAGEYVPDPSSQPTITCFGCEQRVLVHHTAVVHLCADCMEATVHAKEEAYGEHAARTNESASDQSA